MSNIACKLLCGLPECVFLVNTARKLIFGRDSAPNPAGELTLNQVGEGGYVFPIFPDVCGVLISTAPLTPLFVQRQEFLIGPLSKSVLQR